MTLSTTLRIAARNLINTFGNTVAVYTYSTATKTTSEEGDVTITNWGSSTAGKAVDGDNMSQELVQTMQLKENLGDDQKIIRDDLTVAVNDRLTESGVDYRIDSIAPTITQDVVVIQIITVSKVTDTTNW